MPAIASVALLILRLVVGALFVGHGTQKLFGWFEGGGPEGTGRMMGSLGYRPGRQAAVLGGVLETGGGLLLGFGLATALGAALVIAMMVSAALSVHLRNGVWNSKGGFELPLVFATVAVAFALAGPGHYSLDAAVGWRPWGAVVGTVAILLAVAVAVVVDGWRTQRLEEEAVPEERRPAA